MSEDNSYKLSGNSQLSVGGYAYVGFNGGKGTFLHSAGSFAVANGLTIGDCSTSGADYQLSGTGNLSTKWTNVGYFGSGTFEQSGGTHNASTALQIAGLGYGSGTPTTDLAITRSAETDS